jgi:hypothetical protein
MRRDEEEGKQENKKARRSRAYQHPLQVEREWKHHGLEQSDDIFALDEE